MNEKYHILSNGQLYGPADTDQLIQWIAEGRIAPDTTLISSQSSERIMAGQHPELSSWFRPTTAEPPSTPPVAPVPTYSTGAGYGQQMAYRQPDVAYQPPVPVLGQTYGVRNDSGTGSSAQLPESLKAGNWGAFAMSPLWSIANKSWIGLLSLVPYIGWLMCFVLYYKGNEWAWQNRRFESPEHFQQVQRAWNRWGIGYLVFQISCVVLGLIFGLFRGGNP